MFTIEQIKAAHAQVKSGADFPRYIRDIKALGVIYYETYVSDGHSRFTGYGGHEAQWEAKYPALTITERADAAGLIATLQEHQQGKSDYLTFCTQAASFGVDRWKVDISRMTCTYLDRNSNEMLVEQISVQD